MSASSNYPAIKLLQLARESLIAGDLAAAKDRFHSVLRHEPANAYALHHLGLLAWNEGRRAEARSLLEQAVASEPSDIPLLSAYGEMLHDLGEPRPALDIFLRILAIDSSLPEIWNAGGVCFQETSQPVSAIEFFLRALGLQPDYAEALNNLGVVLTEERDLASAIDHFEQALALQPGYPACHNNLGGAYRLQLDYPRAIAAFREAHRLDPTSADFAGAYGEILSLLYDPAAEALLREALRLRPTDPEKHWNLALELLKHGHYLEGWQKYQWRFQRTKNRNPPRPFPQPLWLGEPATDLHNRTLLLHAEQGYGDTLQFLRYLPLVLDRSPSLILEVQPPLHRLATEFASRFGDRVTVLSYGDPLPPFDFHIPTMSLPTAFATTLETIPPALRLTAPATPRTANKPLRIGFAWSGNPTHDRDTERSIPWPALQPLFESLPHCTWISLQTGPPTQLLRDAPMPIEQPTLTDFHDTATLLDTLDVVLTADTALAHLAATQGIPTWLLLPYVADWRWLAPPTHITSSPPNPWYPNLRIFRQTLRPAGEPQQHLWQPVIAEVITALESLAR